MIMLLKLGLCANAIQNIINKLQWTLFLIAMIPWTFVIHLRLQDALVLNDDLEEKQNIQFAHSSNLQKYNERSRC